MDDLYWEEEKKLTFEDFKKIVEKYFKVTKAYIAPGTHIPTFTVQPLETPNYDLKKSFNEMAVEIDAQEQIPLLRKQVTLPMFGEEKPLAPPGPQELVLRLLPKKKDEKKARFVNINVLLLIITIATVMGAAIYLLMSDMYVSVFNTSSTYYYSMMIGYTVAILCIIGIHELGHLTACRLHKIKSSYPYFIPFIPPLGTMGAVIIQKSPPKNKDELFDVGLTGPLFGFLVTLVVTFIGYALTIAFTNQDILMITGATIDQLSSVQFPDPLLFRILEQFMLSPIPYNVYIMAPGGSMVYMLHVVAFAGWIGCFVTGLNLFPLGQLDGGHVARSIFGEKYYKYVSWVAFFGLFLINWLMAVLVLLLSRFSFEHPGPLNDVSPLSTTRKIGSIVFFTVLILTVPMGSFWLF
ncbi:MAG: site-2 protease family protein [Candidatus Helarchaeota archaeon]|nr:site-2 protease family protein [Candidatus Helarchaeota archaeon]